MADSPADQPGIATTIAALDADEATPEQVRELERAIRAWKRRRPGYVDIAVNHNRPEPETRYVPVPAIDPRTGRMRA